MYSGTSATSSKKTTSKGMLKFLIWLAIGLGLLAFALWPSEPEKDGFCRKGHVVQPSADGMGSVCVKVHGG